MTNKDYSVQSTHEWTIRSKELPPFPWCAIWTNEERNLLHILWSREEESDHEKCGGKITQMNGALGQLLAQGASSGPLDLHVCVFAACVCPGVSTPAQTEWVGSVGWRGLPWIPLQAISLSGPAKVSLLPGGARGRGGGTRQQDHWDLSTMCLIATTKPYLSARLNFNTNKDTNAEL